MEVDYSETCTEILKTLLDKDFPEVIEMVEESTHDSEELGITKAIVEKLQVMVKKTESVAKEIISKKEKTEDPENKPKHSQVEDQHLLPQLDTGTLESVSTTEDVNFQVPIDEAGQNMALGQPKWKLCWNQQDMTMPFDMSRNIQVLFLNGILYIGGGDAERTYIENEFKIMSYNMSLDHWNEVISYSTKWFAMVAVDNKLTVVGGRDKDRKDVNTLGVRENENWIYPFPPMPTNRSHSSAATYKMWLIVAGGTTVDLDTLSIIEVLNLDTNQWQKVCDASISFYAMKSVVLDDIWYLMGGYHGHTITHDVFAIQLNDLVANQESFNTWKKLPKLRCFSSSPALMGNELLAVGGRISAYDSVNTIYMYSTDEKKWILAGLLPCALNNCATAIISNILYIFGGYDGANRQKSIHTCSFNEYI